VKKLRSGDYRSKLMTMSVSDLKYFSSLFYMVSSFLHCMLDSVDVKNMIVKDARGMLQLKEVRIFIVCIMSHR
jgi:hypothetical protein